MEQTQSRLIEINRELTDLEEEANRIAGLQLLGEAISDEELHIINRYVKLLQDRDAIKKIVLK